MLTRIFAVFPLALLLVLSGCADEAPSTPIGTISQKAPNFTLPNLDGDMMSFNDLRGKVVYIDFWASWCGPCRAQMPTLKQLWADYQDKDFVLLGVSLDYTQDDWKSYVADEGIDWVHVYDDGASINGAAQSYGVNAIPRTYLIDQEGNIIGSNIHGDALRSEIDKLLN